MSQTKPPSLQDALALYEREFLAGRNLAPLTRQAYLRDLDELAAFLRARAGLANATHVRREHLEGFLSDLDHRALSGNYRRRKIAAIRSLFTFLEERGLVSPSPARKLVPPEREHRQPRYLSEREYKALLDACRHETRDAAVIELLLQTGMRLSELARLSLSDSELPARISKEPDGAGSVRIIGKGRRERTVTLNWKACKAVKAYLAVRPKDTGDERLFLTKFRRGISSRSLERLVEKYLLEAGIHGASVHTLRHTFGTHSVKRGTRLKVVQDVLGHASLDTTTIYVSLAREDMDRQLQEHALPYKQRIEQSRKLVPLCTLSTRRGRAPSRLRAQVGNAIGSEADAARWRAAGDDWVGGTLGASRARSATFARLGVTAIWVSPVFKQVPGGTSYHGSSTRVLVPAAGGAYRQRIRAQGEERMRRQRIHRLITIIREARLPRGERRAARAERRAEQAMRAERDWRDERALQLAAAEAERRRHSPY